MHACMHVCMDWITCECSRKKEERTKNEEPTEQSPREHKQFHGSEGRDIRTVTKEEEAALAVGSHPKEKHGAATGPQEQEDIPIELSFISIYVHFQNM